MSQNEVSDKLINANLISPNFEKFLAEHKLNEKDAIRMLDNVPVFLVESSMGNEYVAVPNEDCSIRVPVDKCSSSTTCFDVDKWLNDMMMEEECGPNKDPREWECKEHVISDLLGVYVFSGSDNVIPCRIFIWTDKITQYVKENTKHIKDIEDRERVLYELVLCHEMMHVLMDVAAYGIAPCPYFNYSNPVYKYVEEALANYMALLICKSHFAGPHVSYDVRRFVFSFVENQGGGYAVGLDLFNRLCRWQGQKIKIKPTMLMEKALLGIAVRWMRAKTQFNYKIACLLAEIWKEYFAAEKAYEDGTIDNLNLEIRRTDAILDLRLIQTES